MALRAFIAIQLSDDLKRQIRDLQADVQRQAPGLEKLGWVRPDGIHLTLRFLGDIEEGQIEALRELLQRASAVAPFALEARGVGAFPDARRPRVIWLGLSGEARAMEKLCHLQKVIEDGVVEMGFPPEPRPFRAHLTLARVRDRGPMTALGKILGLNQDRMVGRWTAGSVALIRSELRPGGSVYTTLVELPFSDGV